MKKIIFFAVFCLVLSLAQMAAQSSVSVTEISFTFERQRGFSTNQFAVWIEDSRGGLVKTLFATKFTAGGGWSKRPESVPLWVEKSGLASMNKKDIDAFSGATPRNGALSYRWDGRDKNGNPASPGEYKIFLEATLRSENRVLYSAPFTLGSRSPSEAEIKPGYFGSGSAERNMIGNVRVTYRP